MGSYGILWTLFIITSLILFYTDFRISVLKTHEIKLRESLILCGLWISVALIYSIFVWYYLGANKTAEYLTAYVIEYSLSIDNMFVFLIIFSYFGIEKKYQPKVLVIGILSAVVMRMIFIFGGIAAISRFSWLIYIFGVILIYTGAKMFFYREEDISPEKNIAFRILKKHLSVEMNIKDGRFFVIKDRRIVPTVMILVLAVIETTDIIFAIDSIPAVLAISQDKLIVYSSNIFAVVGLRSLYFSLAYLNDYFKYLKHGISVVLVYVGFKMLFSRFIHINPFLSLSVVISILSATIIISVIKKDNNN